MLGLILLSNFITLILLVWFKSDAMVEWGTVLGLRNLLKIDDFYSMRMDERYLGINYPSFLKIKYQNFMVNMLACPMCLTIWLSVFILLTLSLLASQPILLLFVPTTTLLTLFTYGVITSLLKLN